MLTIGKLFCLFSFRLVPLSLSLRMKGFPGFLKNSGDLFRTQLAFSAGSTSVAMAVGARAPALVWGISSEASLPQVIEQLGEMLPGFSDMAYFATDR